MTAGPERALVPIDERNPVEAVSLLARAFPGSEAFWRGVLARATDVKGRDLDWPLGFVLHVRDAPAGVILTFASRRSRPNSEEPVVMVNLASWYVSREARAAAPWMLFKVLGWRRPAVFTDLTPSRSVMSMNEGLGFTRWHEGILFGSWPQTWLRGRSGASIRPPDERTLGRLDRASRTLLEDHAGLGCLTGVLEDGEELNPVVFQRVRWKNVPAARLLYAGNPEGLVGHAHAISRFVLRHGFPLWLMDTPRRVRIPGLRLLDVRQERCHRGLPPGSGVDYAYSEFVYLNIFYP